MSARAAAAESRALLAGARVVSDDASRASLAEAVAGSPDWGRLVTLARAEGTAGILFARLREIDAPVPLAALGALEAAYRATWARNAALAERWREATTLLRAAGIETLTHKGLALVHSVYPDAALRPMADIDMLIRPGDVEATTRVLRSAGYRTSGARIEAEEAFRGYRHFVRDRVVIDLHWELARYTRYESIIAVDHDGLWARARPLDVGGVLGLTLAPEDTLLHLALHLTLGSEFGRLVWFVDVDALLGRLGARFDWERAVAEARRWRVGAIVSWVLGVVESSLGTRVPREIPARLGRRPARSALVAVCIGARRPPSVSGRLADSRVYLAEALLMDRVVDVLRIVWGSLFPSRAWIGFHYAVTSPWRLRLWQVLHPLRVIGLATRRFR